jgi:Histidine kinase-, DNA gyrase B-, and HSP90-like ATPase
MAAAPMNSREVIPQRLAIRAMRDSGYKSTAHAAAELIDNAIQVDAKTVEVFIVEERELVHEHERWRIKQIAVVDDGSGMNETVLQMALQFGNGTHLNDRKGIGRFGMGIPNSSISQCRRVDIWTWQAGPDNAITSCIDINDVESGAMIEVPEAVHSPLAYTWRQWSHTADLSESGTLVVWSELDRVTWKGSKATLDNIELLVGRIYRKFLAKGVVIRLAVVRNGSVEADMDRNAQINDPLYLTAPSCTPPPFHDQPMYRPYGETGEERFSIEFNGAKHDVFLRFSYAKDEARIRDDGKNPGDESYGKHARANVGVSVVRADRELELDTSWVNRDLRERWWGAEIEFPPELDEVFGVTNNKQSATHFGQMAAYYSDDNRDQDWKERRDEWAADGDLRLHLINVCNRLATHLNKIRVLLRQQTAGARTAKQQRHEDKVADRATRKFKERQDEGFAVPQDQVPLDKQKVQEDLVEKGYAEKNAQEIADAVEDHDRKVIFVIKDNPESTSFFHPDFLPGVTEIVFNASHPAYPLLLEMLDPDLITDDIETLKARIYGASDTLKMLLCAWARYEMEERDGARREKVKEVRQEWGKMAHQFLADSDVEPVTSSAAG